MASEPGVPRQVVERPSGSVRLAGPNVKAATGSHAVIDPESTEDAPARVPGLGSSAMKAAGALADVGAAASRTVLGSGGSDGRYPRGTPVWLVVLLGLLGGGGGSVGAREILGHGDEVVALTARMDAADKAEAARDARIDATEKAIADAEVTRVTEVRYLIDLSVKGFQQLGVERSSLPDVPDELAARYRATEVEQTRRKLFSPPPPAPVEQGTVPPP